MQRVARFFSSPRNAAIGSAFAVLLLLALPPFWYDGLAARGWLPHQYCGLWTRGLVSAHVLSDFLIGLSYVAISTTLAYLVLRARRDLPFHWVLLAFGAFIVSCGATHWMEIYTAWVPAFTASAALKVVTALASLMTAIVLPPLVPDILALIRARKESEARKRELQEAHVRLQEAHARVRELDESRTRFFTNVSHELRTPLMLILGPLRKLRDAHALDSALRGDLDGAERNARTLLKHVNDLLDVAKLDAGKMDCEFAETDLACLVRCAVGHFENFAAERKIAFGLEAPEWAPAQVDPDKIMRVLVNLLSNAFKFTPDGGAVRCVLRRELLRVVLQVHDTGPGVKADQREEIFDRFRQADGDLSRRFGGTGLGLSIAREFVELHHGTIRVEEAPGGGALFTVELPPQAPPNTPVRPAPTERGGVGSEAFRQAVQDLRNERRASDDRTVAASEPPGAPPGDAPLVLVVEDNPEMVRFLCEALSGEFRVVPALDGRAGVAAAVRLRPDLILSDIMMPGLDGTRLVQEVRKRPELEDVPIVILTAFADDHMRVRLLREGAQDFIEKPFAVEELLARVRNWIAVKRARQVLQRECSSQSRDLATLAVELADRSRQVKSALARAEAGTRAKDEFLQTLSHELRTPLTAILGWASLLRARAPGARKLEQGLEIIERNGKAQLRLITDLLDLSRIMAGKVQIVPRPVPVAPIVRGAVEAVRLAADAKGLALEARLDEVPRPVLGDADRLQQVVWNLLTNAIKFTPKGGRVAVRLETVGDHAVVRVADSGEGIEAEFLPHLFERLRQEDSSSTRKYGGLGLGLAIVRHLTEIHGGSVTAESEGKGRGAIFTIRIPLMSATAMAVAPAEEDAGSRGPGPLDGLRVLVVDDELDARTLVVAVLEQHGAKVTAVSSVGEALRALEAGIDVLISDLAMPEEDGYGLIRKLRAKGAPIPAVALTAYAGEPHVQEALAAGFQRHLSKPVTAADLVSAIGEVAGRGERA